MFLSLLTVIGVFISDVLLAILIRGSDSAGRLHDE